MQDIEATAKEKRKSSIIYNFFKGFCLLLTYELIEELLEEAIAWGITTAISKALSFVLVVILTQFTKVTAKSISKILVIALKPIVKKAIYRPGNDKVEWLDKMLRKLFKIEESNDNSNELIETNNEKSLNNNMEAVKMAETEKEVKVSKFKQFVQKVIEFVKCNKKSILSTATALATSVGSGGAIQMWCASSNIPNLYTWLIAVVVGIIMFVLTELGVSAAGWETLVQFTTRTAEEKVAKEVKATEKAAMKVVEETKKEAEKLAKENAKLAEEAEIKAKAQAYLDQHPELLNK